MSMLAMAGPSPHSTLKRDFPWEGVRSSEYSPRSRAEPERFALPSIRQAFPEIHLRIDAPTRTPATTSPTTRSAAAIASPGYVHSPSSASKRRRLSSDEEAEIEGAGHVPRFYTGSRTAAPGQLSPTLAPRSAASESWASSRASSPFLMCSGPSSLRSPVALDANEHHQEPRHLPGLSHLTFDRDAHHISRICERPVDEYQPARPYQGVSAGPILDATPSPYRPPPYGYQNHHPNRGQSLSMSAVHHFDRATFSSGYGPHVHDFVRFGDHGTMSMGGDNRQRKRRGNLPKETTDKLRAWFVAHLHHPYPTEDEKQEMMRQTGLQMNQISNWFINARRRQLPQMMSNSRAEPDALAARGGDAKILPTTERAEFADKGASVPLSDGEGSAFDEELSLQQRRPAHIKRGSI